MNKALSHVDAALARANAKVAHLRALRDKLLSKTVIVCDRCKSSHTIGSLVYIQTHWYTAPFSCTGGDYWNQGDGEWDCPTCKIVNRLFKQPEIMKLKHLFASVRDCYCDYRHKCKDCREIEAKL